MSNTRGNPIFAVRLRPEMQEAIREAAKREGLQVAQWVERAAQAALERPGAGQGGDGEGVAIDAILERLTALEDMVEELRSARASASRANQSSLPARAVLQAPTARKLPKGGRSLTDEEKAQVLELQRQGMSQGAIAKRFGVSQSGISNVLKRHGGGVA